MATRPYDVYIEGRDRPLFVQADGETEVRSIVAYYEHAYDTACLIERIVPGESV